MVGSHQGLPRLVWSVDHGEIVDLLLITLVGVLIVSTALAEIADSLISQLSFAVWRLNIHLQTCFIRPSA